MASIFFSFTLIAMYDGSGQMPATNHNSDRHPHNSTHDAQFSTSLVYIWREIYEFELRKRGVLKKKNEVKNPPHHTNAALPREEMRAQPPAVAVRGVPRDVPARGRA